jgi:xanthine/CO dehydrogenase XdhC/CoxF family maturation factor
VNEIHELVQFWERRSNDLLALATLVRTRGSSYRRPGARMLISRDGAFAGSLSAGCIEEEVIARARHVLEGGQPQLIVFDTRRRFGCSGSIEILIERASQHLLHDLRRYLQTRRNCEVATIFENSSALGSRIVVGFVEPGAFVQTIEPPLRLFIIGLGPDAVALQRHAMLLGWETVMIESVPQLPELPDQRTAAVVATHNFGRDCAALRHLLPLGLRYLGLVGPRKRRDEILIDVIDSGAEMTSQLFAPAGLHLAAESPEEIALAIAAEIQCIFAGGTPEHLRDRKAPIHDSVVQWFASAQ